MSMLNPLPKWEDKPPDAFPEPGDMGWLWYKPVTPGCGASLYPSYASYCGRCEVFDVPNIMQKRFKCWSCGKFLPRPHSWSEKLYRPTGPGYGTRPATQETTEGTDSSE